jgi:hypothetical protein
MTVENSNAQIRLATQLSSLKKFVYTESTCKTSSMVFFGTNYVSSMRIDTVDRHLMNPCWLTDIKHLISYSLMLVLQCQNIWPHRFFFTICRLASGKRVSREKKKRWKHRAHDLCLRLNVAKFVLPRRRRTTMIL